MAADIDNDPVPGRRESLARVAAAGLSDDDIDRLIKQAQREVEPRSPNDRTSATETAMASITSVAQDFFAACETGEGWEGCKAYCQPDATFAAQAEPLAEMRSLRDYTEWMKGLLTILRDGRYEVKSFATDETRRNVCAYGVFTGTHTGQGGPCPPTGKTAVSDYVYVMQFDGDKIRHMTKIWHAGWALKQLGW